MQKHDNPVNSWHIFMYVLSFIAFAFSLVVLAMSLTTPLLGDIGLIVVSLGALSMLFGIVSCLGGKSIYRFLGFAAFLITLVSIYSIAEMGPENTDIECPEGFTCTPNETMMPTCEPGYTLNKDMMCVKT